MVLPARGLTGLGMGVSQAEEPVLGKEGIGPPDVVEAAGDPRLPMLLAHDVAQPPTDPSVERCEGRAVTVLEVFKPAAQRAIEVLDDLGQAVSRCAFGLCPDRVPRLREGRLLNFFRLLARGRRRPAANRYPRKSKPSSCALTNRVLVGCRVRPASAVHCCTTAKALPDRSTGRYQATTAMPEERRSSQRTSWQTDRTNPFPAHGTARTADPSVFRQASLHHCGCRAE
jgi:hypothetical protein